MSKHGHNVGYVEELYARYRSDPNSVSAAWRDYFADYVPRGGSLPSGPPAPAKPAAIPSGNAEPLRGVEARIVENMNASLEVPTATSARTVAVKSLEENRRIINQHQSMVAAPRISFTHLIAWALVRSLERHPTMNDAYAEIDSKPQRVSRDDVRLGLAIDVERGDKRVLLVPNIVAAQTLDFPSFVNAYDSLIVRARRNELAVDDFQNTTVTLTNPGMIGTALSVPRLMQGQGTIVGVGAIGLPAEFVGMAADTVAELGLSKVMTITSTYDHRVIQGAASGAFLAEIDGLLQGAGGFWQRIFAELGIPREPIPWSVEKDVFGSSDGSVGHAVARQTGVLQLIRVYRVRGHLRADLDPLRYEPELHPELELSHYGLSLFDLDRKFVVQDLDASGARFRLREILDRLNTAYCRHIGVEFMHITDQQVRNWIQQELEQPTESTPREWQIRILKKLNAAEAFESFIGTNYVGQKRFSLEGAETTIPMLDALLERAAAGGVTECVVGMAHRGRLNVLANVIGKSHAQIFREFEGDIDPDSTHGSGDVKYHLGATGTFEAADGRKIKISLASNPSHLEAVNPIVEGWVRARQDRLGDTERKRVLPILIHGDAAFSGQGVVAETLNLSGLGGYRTGGTVHIVVNNQIGFTTGPQDQRSSRYATDVGKMVGAPILHVNGDHPEDAVRVIRMAMDFRQRFQRDVIVDLVCYRRWGHNEGDDPSFTHPLLYEKIKKHRSVRKLYTDQLLRSGEFDPETAEQALEDFRKRLRAVHDEVRQAQRTVVTEVRSEMEASEGAARAVPPTAPAEQLLNEIVQGLTRIPEGFTVHPKLQRLLQDKLKRFDDDRIDWSLAESLSFGSLVCEGTTVRLSGEDSGRGTFSQRHAILYDHKTAKPHIPLAYLTPDQASFTVFDSLLSEFAVLGFEYGYSVAASDALVLWEAQFGDFVNGAQVIIDQFIATAEEKWDQKSKLTLLLPHGYEGQGPEHSSARLERFLQLAARGNLRIANPSTPAQYFHLLRMQATQQEVKPLIVATPKSLLRHKACVSTREDLTGRGFCQILDDERQLERDGVERILLCSGKIYYDLLEKVEELDIDDVALVRVEQLYPLAVDRLIEIVESYPSAEQLLWVQEEPRNMGAWNFIQDRLSERLPQGRKLSYIGRPRAASTATGSHKRHVKEQQTLVEQALGHSRSGVAAGGKRS